ncbi:MAG: hypothetical protein KGI73_00580 [Patescibacteria group bacterium]|nr:hypothetical protein [Patescibacteria group bacterium]
MSEKEPSSFTPEQNTQIDRLVVLEGKRSDITLEELQERQALRDALTKAGLMGEVTKRITGR